MHCLTLILFPTGTGCAPFRSLIEERVSQSAGGKLGFVLKVRGVIALRYSCPYDQHVRK